LKVKSIRDCLANDDAEDNKIVEWEKIKNIKLTFEGINNL
jgi:hypothetical protein